MANRKIPSELERALVAFEAGALDKIIERKRSEDFEALRRLVSLEPSVNPDHRQRAIYALGRWGDSSVVPSVVKMLPSLKESHCITALEALGRLGTNDACAAIESFADNPSPQIRKFVVEALYRIGSPAAEAKLRKMANEDSEGWVRDLVAKRMKALTENAAGYR